MSKEKNGEKKTNKEESKKIRKTKKELKSASEKRKETVETKRMLYFLETAAIVVIAFLMIVLLLNKTFFREEYVGSTEKGDFKINIPLLYFFVKDEDKVVEFKTLRKSEYDREYFDNYLASLDKYSCKSEQFYYDKKYKLAIYDIDIEKNIAVKTIRISYDIFEINDVCN
jgi:hypothetical protein